MTVPAPPPVPSRQDPVNFSSKADELMAWLPVFVAAVNTLQSDVNSNQVAATSAAGTATGKAAEAAAARDIVMAAVNYKGPWSALSGALAIPASVLHGGAVWMLTQSIGNVAAETPGVSGNWINVTPASGLGSAAYQSSSAFQAAFGALAGIVKANGSGGVSATTAADILALIGANAVQNSGWATSAGTASIANTIVDGAVSTTAKLANRVVTWAKVAAMTTGKLIGRSSAGGGDPEEISIGANLSLSGGVLSASVPVSSVGGYAGVVSAAQVAAAATTGYGYTPAPNTAFVGVSGYSVSTGTYTGDYYVRLTRANSGFVDVQVGSYDNTPPYSPG